MTPPRWYLRMSRAPPWPAVVPGTAETKSCPTFCGRLIRRTVAATVALSPPGFADGRCARPACERACPAPHAATQETRQTTRAIRVLSGLLRLITSTTLPGLSTLRRCSPSATAVRVRAGWLRCEGAARRRIPARSERTASALAGLLRG